MTHRDTDFVGVGLQGMLFAKVTVNQASEFFNLSGFARNGLMRLRLCQTRQLADAIDLHQQRQQQRHACRHLTHRMGVRLLLQRQKQGHELCDVAHFRLQRQDARRADGVEQLGHHRGGYRFQRLLRGGDHRAIGGFRKMKAVHMTGGNHQQTGCGGARFDVFNLHIDMPIFQIQDLKKRIVSVRLNEPVVDFRTLRNPLEIERAAPTRRGFIAVQIVVRDNP